MITINLIPPEILKQRAYHAAYAKRYRKTARGKAKLELHIKKWRAKNPDRVRATKRAHYHADPENKVKSRDQQRAWREGNREKFNARMRRWKDNNFDKVRQQWTIQNLHRRGVRLLKRYNHETLAAKMAYYGNRCIYCGAPADCIDHVKPVARGGPSLLCNLVPSCRKCNQSKGKKWNGVQAWKRCNDYGVSFAAISSGIAPHVSQETMI